MDIKLLCIGDVVGRPGRHVISQAVPALIRERNIDCVIANVENAAAGSGLTELLYEKFLRYGVSLMTMGDHIYRKAEILPYIERLRDEAAVPIIYVSHSVGEVTRLATTVVALAGGRMTASGSAIAVLNRLGAGPDYNTLWLLPYVTNRIAGGRKVGSRTNSITGTEILTVGLGTPIGAGTLEYNAATQRFRWLGIGEAFGTARGFSAANGKLTINVTSGGATESYIVLRVTPGSLPACLMRVANCPR